MKTIFKASICLMAFTILGFSQISNVQFKDLDGNEYDLYEELAKGKSVLVHSTGSRWGYCPGSVPDLNAYWRKYGCDKCDSYKLLVLDVGCYGNDSKSVFTNFINNRCKCEYPAVWHQEGGKSPSGNNFNDALRNGGSGNPKYLIKPDKSFKKSPRASEINAAGGNVQHVCPTHITNTHTHGYGQRIVLHNVNKNGLTLKINEDCNFSLSFYSLNGQLINTISKSKVSTGVHTFCWENSNIAHGVYLATINVDNVKTTQRVVIE